MAKGGSYILVLELERPLIQCQVGKFGCFDFAAGFYLYVGSAFGSGGLRARLAHHARREKPRLHWHVDYLRREALLREAWTVVGPERLECVWCRALAAHPQLTIPVPRFGARDTGCAAHLFYTPEMPEFRAFEAVLGSSAQRCVIASVVAAEGGDDHCANAQVGPDGSMPAGPTAGRNHVRPAAEIGRGQSRWVADTVGGNHAGSPVQRAAG